MNYIAGDNLFEIIKSWNLFALFQVTFKEILCGVVRSYFDGMRTSRNNCTAIGLKFNLRRY